MIIEFLNSSHFNVIKWRKINNLIFIVEWIISVYFISISKLASEISMKDRRTKDRSATGRDQNCRSCLKGSLPEVTYLFNIYIYMPIKKIFHKNCEINKFGTIQKLRIQKDHSKKFQFQSVWLTPGWQGCYHLVTWLMTTSL